MLGYLPRLLAGCGALLFNSLTAQQRDSGLWERLSDCQLVAAADNQAHRFTVQHAQQTFRIRLYFVDSPPCDDSEPERLRAQAAYYALPESEVIAAGKAARQYTQRFVGERFTVITQWADARSDADPCYFALIEKDGSLLSAALVQHGAARLYGLPPHSSWPGGWAPGAYLQQLKQAERGAQQRSAGIWAAATNSPQLAGLEQLGSPPPTAPAAQRRPFGGARPHAPIFINRADAAALQTLPGIGPVLAERIIAARPFASVDALAAIPGISVHTIDRFRAQVLLDAPPPAPFTADFYRAKRARYLDREVTVRVASVARSTRAAPPGFQAVRIDTAYKGTAGGAIDTFIPDEFYDAFIQYYRQAERDLSAFLYEYDTNIVLVYRRK